MNKILYIILFYIWVVVYNNYAPKDPEVLKNTIWPMLYYGMQYLLIVLLCFFNMRPVKTRRERNTLRILSVPAIVMIWPEVYCMITGKTLSQAIKYVNGEVFDWTFGAAFIIVLIISFKKNV